MAEVPQTPDQFSNYYTQLLGSQGPASSTPAPVGFPKRADQPNEMGFLGRFVDILSRPLRIVSNPVQKALEMPEKYDAIRMEEAAGGDVSFGEKLAPVGSLLAAPFTGFSPTRMRISLTGQTLLKKLKMFLTETTLIMLMLKTTLTL